MPDSPELLFELKPLNEIYANLWHPPHLARRHIRHEEIPTTSGGKYHIDFMPHYHVRNYFDKYAPGWEWVEQPYEFNRVLYVRGTLTIVGLLEDGTAYRRPMDAIGHENSALDKVHIGDPSSNASAQALRRAAMLGHGFLRGLWDTERDADDVFEKALTISLPEYTIADPHHAVRLFLVELSDCSTRGLKVEGALTHLRRWSDAALDDAGRDRIHHFETAVREFYSSGDLTPSEALSLAQS